MRPLLWSLRPGLVLVAFVALALLATALAPSAAFAHGVDDATREFLLGNRGSAVVPFIYIGAKHMVTGYDHLLFLVGVIFFLYRNRDVLIYVSFFTLGHSLTLLFGVLAQVGLNAYLIDAVIGLSVVYKGFDNLRGFERVLGFQPNTKAAVLIFGLFHGFGLATKLQEFQLPSEGLLTNLISFNLGVELGQFIALGLVLIGISFWRRHASYLKMATATNVALMTGGFLLVGFQLTGFFAARN